MHGFNLVLEGVRQIRGTSTCAGRRTPTSRSSRAAKACPTSAILFTKDRVIDGDAAGCSPISTSRRRRRSGTGPRAASCSCRRAASCGARRMPPRPMCPRCRSIDVTWEPTSGRGRDLVVHRPASAAAARVRRARAVQRDHRRARRGPDDPLRRQPRRERRRRDQRDRSRDDRDRRARARRVPPDRRRVPAAVDPHAKCDGSSRSMSDDRGACSLRRLGPTTFDELAAILADPHVWQFEYGRGLTTSGIGSLPRPAAAALGRLRLRRLRSARGGSSRADRRGRTRSAGGAAATPGTAGHRRLATLTGRRGNGLCDRSRHCPAATRRSRRWGSIASAA